MHKQEPLADWMLTCVVFTSYVVNSCKFVILCFVDFTNYFDNTAHGTLHYLSYNNKNVNEHVAFLHDIETHVQSPFALLMI